MHIYRENTPSHGMELISRRSNASPETDQEQPLDLSVRRSRPIIAVPEPIKRPSSKPARAQKPLSDCVGRRNSGREMAAKHPAAVPGQLVCVVCSSKATGLHYGAITCEGCKGFFKRTVQNGRLAHYKCTTQGNNCEVVTARRSRCQACRFAKCLRQGMVVAGVRENRKAGGRNDKAIYQRQAHNKGIWIRLDACPSESGRVRWSDTVPTSR